jgi:Putative capsular polysaccharide synthesis protein
VIRRLVGQNYFLSKQYALARMRRAQPAVVVFSMGKTGSTAIARAVQHATGNRVFQIFRLQADRLAQAERRYRVNNGEAKRQGRDPGALPFRGALHLWESEYLLRHPPAPSAPWTVITTVREPIAQAVSALFHGGGRRGVLTDTSTVELLTTALVEERWIRAPLRWFDREFVPALGIDVFEHPFDPLRGHGVIETPSVRVLLLRQENLDSAPDALARFLGLARPVAVPTRNEASTKGYAPAYREFLAKARIPESVRDQAYRSRYARHFYADSELARLHQRWGAGSGE